VTQIVSQGNGTRVVLVTGATSGIGFHTARELAARGACVLITGRDPRRGEEAVKAIAAAGGRAGAVFIQVDHSTVGANSQLGAVVGERLGNLGLPQRLDVLINNVGGIFPTRTVTADGYEATLAVNFLAPVVVTHSVLPLLRASSSSRCVNVTSSLGWLARQMPGELLADIQSTGAYVGIRAHAKAKLLTAAWTRAISRQLAGTGLVAATVNPGMAWTAMTQALTPQVVPSWRYVYPLVRFFQKRGDPGTAAQVCVELAWTADPAAISGQYITEHGKPGKYPPIVAAPAVQEQVVSTAADLAHLSKITPLSRGRLDSPATGGPSLALVAGNAGHM
jgi:NAD(P)-dependent dehydrogenase (short-subunit alcohol dehydrogenase family)